MPGMTRTQGLLELNERVSPGLSGGIERIPGTCVFLVERERVGPLRSAVPTEMDVRQARDARDLSLLLGANIGPLLVVDPTLLSPETVELISTDLGGWRVVIDTATTAIGLTALWQILRVIPAAIILREHDGPGRILAAFRPTKRATDELMQRWAPMLSELPPELSRTIMAITCGAAHAESVKALATLVHRSRRWTEIHFHAAGVRSVWRIVVGSRIARAHDDLINPSLRTTEIAQRHQFGSLRTLQSQIRTLVGVSADVVRSGMGARELANRIAERTGS